MNTPVLNTAVLNTPFWRRSLVALAYFAVLAGLVAAPAAADLASVFPSDLAPPADAVTHPSGMVSLVIEAGEGTLQPDDNDMVSLQVIGRDSAGKVFQDTYSGEKPMGLELSRTFPAFREALKLMVTGETRRVWLPAELSPDTAYGPSGPVVFDIELLGVKVLPNPPADLVKPENAERTPFGTFTRRVSEGTGKVHPAEDAAVLVDYVGWSPNGEIFDASHRRLRPTLFPLAKVMPAFSDCVQRMVEGEQRLCWIPAAVAQGAWPNSPGGDLIFHLQLIAIGDGSVFEGVPAAVAGGDTQG